MDVKLDVLFKELDGLIENQNYKKAITACDNILAVAPKDIDVIKCKCVCYIKEAKFEELIQYLDLHPDVSDILLFERGYALYRLGRLSETLQLTRQQTNTSQKLLELESQVLYRLNEFARSAEIYTRLLEEFKENTAEVKTNLIAALASSGNTAACIDFVAKNKSTLTTSYEFAYNVACCYIEKGDLKTAEAYLIDAQKLCKESLSQEGFSAGEIEEELAIIQTQLAYIKQLSGDSETANRIYEEILKQSPSDLAVVAVATNNSVALGSDKKMQASRKLKHILTEQVQKKLNAVQKRAIDFNYCLSLLEMNKYDQCRDTVNSLQQRYPDSDVPALIGASLLFKEKKIDKAKEKLQEFATAYPKSSTKVQIALAQMELQQGNIKDCIITLKSITALAKKPAMIATLVKLYEQIHDNDGAIQVLDEGLKNLKENNDGYLQILRKNAEFKMNCKRYKEAAQMYEKLLEINRNDLEALPLLVMACSCFDSSLAEKYSARIPVPDLEQINADELENLSIATVKKKVNKKPDVQGSTKEGTPATGELKPKKKKKAEEQTSKTYGSKSPS